MRKLYGPESKCSGCRGNPVIARGLCGTCYQRHRRPPVNVKRTKAEMAALMAEAATATECVIYRQSGTRRATVQIDGQTMNASRAVWLRLKGDPGELHVLHNCGRGREGCITLSHMYLGTEAENGADRVADGVQPRGQEHGRAKLTEDDAREILRRYIRGVPGQGGGNSKELAAEFNVDRKTITNIATGRKWGHLQRPHTP